VKPKEFKLLFADVANAHGFTAAHGGWYREMPVGLLVLNFQKSSFGSYFELNLKLLLGRGAPVDTAESKKLTMSLVGDIFRRQPEEFREAFDLDSDLTAAERQTAIRRMFCECINRIVSECTDAAGILRLRDEGIFYLLPTIEARLRAR
jgi:hypothetical protein